MPRKISLLAAILVAVVLIVASCGKLFYPRKELLNLDFTVCLFELMLSAILIVCHRRYEVWLLAAVVFALWGGYALFWDLQELPCSCLGESIEIPQITTLLLDAFFFVVSVVLAGYLGASWKAIGLLLMLAPLLVLGGYKVGKKVYDTLEVVGSSSGT